MTVEGSTDFEVSSVTWDDGTIEGTINYTGTCDLVTSPLRSSYAKGGTLVTGAEIDGIDTHVEVGPLAQAEPYTNLWLGEDKFAPDGITFVFSDVACA